MGICLLPSTLPVLVVPIKQSKSQLVQYSRPKRYPGDFAQVYQTPSVVTIKTRNNSITVSYPNTPLGHAIPYNLFQFGIKQSFVRCTQESSYLVFTHPNREFLE